MHVPIYVAGGEEQVLLDGDGDNKELRDMDLLAGRQARGPAIVSGLGDEELLNCGHPVLDVSNSNSMYWQTFGAQSSSEFLSLSPPHSPPSWRHQMNRRPGEQALAAEASDTVLSGYVSLAGEFQIPELEPEARAFSDIPIDYIPLQKLKDRLISEEDDGVQSMESSLVSSWTLASSTVGFSTIRKPYLNTWWCMYWIPGLSATTWEISLYSIYLDRILM